MSEAIAPLKFCEKITGLATFSYEIKPKSSKAKIIFKIAIFHLLSMLLYFSYLVILTINKEFIISKNGTFNIAENFSRIYLSSILLFLVVISTYRGGNNYAEILENLLNIDSLIKQFNIELNFTYLKKKIILFLVVILLYMWISGSFYFLSSYTDKGRSSIYLFTVLYMPSISFMMTISIFSVYIHIATGFYELINKKILKMIKDFDSFSTSKPIVLLKNNYFYQTNYCYASIDKINAIWNLHHNVYNLCKAIDKTFSFKILLIFAGSFTSIVFNLYSTVAAVSEYFHGRNNERYSITMWSIVVHQIITQFLAVVIPSILCTNCQKEVVFTIFLYKKLIVN